MQEASGPTGLDKAAWFALRALVVLGAVLAGLWVAGRLRIVLLPVAVALLMAAPLRPVADRLANRLGRSLAAAAAVFGLVLVVAATIGLAGSAVASNAGELRAAVTDGMDDVQDWLTERGVEERQVADARRQLGERWPTVLRGAAADGAVVVGEVLAGLILAIVLAIFILRDADRAVEALARRSPPRRAARIRLGADASWRALRRYLLGASLLGLLEAVVIGGTVAFFGTALAVPVAAFTFLAAFVPIVGAIVAGIVAVLAALVEGGPAAALVVAVVAVVVQQLDGDLLAPLVYGRAVELHPAAVLVAITTGTAVAGLPGAVLAVPILSVAVAVSRATDGDSVTAEVRGQAAAAAAANAEAASADP